MAVVTLNKTNYEAEVMGSDKPVLIDFYADWCGPCRMLASSLEALAAKYPLLRIGKVNVDEEGELAMRFGISSIPFVAVFRNGALAASSLGYVSDEELAERLGL